MIEIGPLSATAPGNERTDSMLCMRAFISMFLAIFFHFLLFSR
jgi:hypothetical protein